MPKPSLLLRYSSSNPRHLVGLFGSRSILHYEPCRADLTFSVSSSVIELAPGDAGGVPGA